MSVFTRKGDVLRPDRATRAGRGTPDAMHGGAPARAARARDRERSRPRCALARLTVEFLGAGAARCRCSVDAEITRPRPPLPGRRGDASRRRPRGRAARARVAAPRRGDVDGPARRPTAAPLEPRPGRPRARARSRPRRRGRSATTTMELRFADGLVRRGRPGDGVVPPRSARSSRARSRRRRQRAVAAADFGNGISRVLDWNEWLFINTDLTVHLHREPEGEWVGARRAHDARAQRLGPRDLDAARPSAARSASRAQIALRRAARD